METQVKIQGVLRGQGWYDLLVEECRDIKVERAWNIVNEVLLCKMDLGIRITQDLAQFDKFEQGRGQALQELSGDIGISRREIYRVLLFYEEAKGVVEERGSLPKLAIFSAEELVNGFLDFHKIGKAVSWYGIYTKCLPGIKLEEQKKPKDKKSILLKCLAKRYSGIDPTWEENCGVCYTKGICRAIVGLMEKELSS